VTDTGGPIIQKSPSTETGVDKNTSTIVRISISKFAKVERKFHVIICLSILIVGLFFTIFPGSWLTSSNVGEFVVWVTSIWPKINSDVQVINSLNAINSARYVLVYIFSFSVFIFGTFFQISMLQKQEMFEGLLPAYFTRINLTLFPILLIIVIYLTIFDQWFAMSDVRVSHQIFGSFACLFWPPLLFGTLAIGVLRTIGIYLAKSHGKLA
jgi:hypothetical protein